MRTLKTAASLLCLLVFFQSFRDVSAADYPAVVAMTTPLGAEQFDPTDRIVDSIEIDNRNIYDLTQAKYNNVLFSLANKLHVVTRQGIVRRELLLAVGQAFSPEAAEETARNIRTTLPVNDAWIELAPLGDTGLIVRVVTVDQWSLLGGLRSFERSGQETEIQLGFEERNLLGRSQFVSFDYYYQNTDEDFVTAAFRESRLFGRPWYFRIDYSTNPKSKLKQATFGRQFYNLSQKWSCLMTVSDGGGRSERFFGGQEVAQWQRKSDYFNANASFRWGPYRRKTTINCSYTYKYQTVSDRRVFDTTAFGPADFPRDSVYHEVDLGIKHSWSKYLVLKRINGFNYNEDFTLGIQTVAVLGRAFKPGFRDYVYDYTEAGMSAAARVGNLLVSGEYSRSFWFRGGVDVRRSTEFTVRAYHNQFEFLTLAVASRFRADRSGDPNPLNLGGANGLRGYVKEYASGSRVHAVNIEGRFYPGVEILSVLVGGVVFTDIARTWPSGAPVTLRDYHQSFGAGLRISLERLSRSELVRVDAAVTPNGTWEISIGTGQYF